MNVGLTRDELLGLIAGKCDNLSRTIRTAPSMIGGGITDKEIDETVSRISALTAALFDPQTTITSATNLSVYGASYTSQLLSGPNNG